MNRLVARLRNEDGMSMIMVIGMAGIFAVVLAVLTSTSINGLRQVRRERQSEQSLHVADSGIDHTLFKLTQNRTATVDGHTPTTWNTGEQLPSSAFADVPSEKAWAVGLANAAPASRVIKTAEGEWVVIKPKDASGNPTSVIYSVGFVPTRANPARTRVVRSEYDFAGFSPSAAVLTDGSLEISGSLDITGANGSAHANGNITGSGSGADVAGYLSAVGTYTPGGVNVGNTALSGGGMPPKEVPLVEPRDFYQFSQYDLCPNGQVKAGPAYSAGPGANTVVDASDTQNPKRLLPCGGPTLLGTNNYRGWDFAGSSIDGGITLGRWRYNDNTAYDGVYYLYRGSADISGNPGEDASPWLASIIAEPYFTGAENHSNCSPGHKAGDIDMSGGPDLRYSDLAAPVTFIAGRDLSFRGNGSASAVGAFLVHEQFDISGNATIDGVVIANDLCNTTGSPVDQGRLSTLTGTGGINYNGGLELPIGVVARITSWLEL
ncbi:MAG TPA: hypothetical protein VND22_07460 [Actinomycetota bacterium]|nr:hypothetical protein [Actinomycetota bacterium]